ncbi:Z1 domain-containing protein [Pseudonocardia sp. WMMC193]|uniref:Z1 domain-containing protein n=1 Tax=Pseudonocardia sp. WMMC193 TaxID=2911965 RepID=UPI001F2F99AA|nr:Z1 domain-containing protein [Pseudonocardia sp. WMMC193]MCF7552180.1 Z1 domain-containing protein [Pseudonocardia sp. WMMC193]
MTTTVDSEMLDNAIRLVLNTAVQGEVWTREVIEARVGPILGVLALSHPDRPLPDAADVIRQVEARVVVSQPAASSLVDSRGHEPWLAEAKDSIQWKFWGRYRRYLEDVELLPREVIRRLDDLTDGTLGKLESPAREGEWDRRGLVVGQVQSGKTSNYTGLICKAADAGYKLILVLAGIHNSLRSQTQLRLDEGFLGIDTQYLQRIDQDNNQHRIGVGAMVGFERLNAASLTTSAEAGDFRAATARQLALPIGDYPVVLVVKKHAGILTNIHDWVTTIHGTPDADGRMIVRDVPLLVIDDEADNASINTGKLTRVETDPPAVNRSLRKILHAFAKSAYVGYTATPYANLYVEAEGEHSKYGGDVFPRSFIDVLRPPTNYFGPERVFGLDEGDSGGEPPLPIHRVVNDQTTWMPDKHDKTWNPPSSLPESLKTALRAFVLTCAARRARGDVNKHNSMLVHVSRFQDVQARVAQQVGDELSVLKDRLRYGDGDRPTKLIEELEQLWFDDFVVTTAKFPEGDFVTVSWEEVKAQLLPAISKIELRVMNGQAKDALEYYERRREGLSVVAVGGNKLSRGLTLEGLSVSYYLRASLMYDTLLQMGRWFGYRPRYEDLCRLYTTTDLYSWYREITQASDELRGMLEDMAAQRATPADFGLRVRTSAAGLSITAANKMRRAQRVRLSFSGGIPETIVFDTQPSALDANRAALETLCSGLGEPELTENKNHLWRQVAVDEILRFLEKYRGDAQAVRSRPDLIAGYVRECQKQDELRTWDVMLVDNRSRRNGTDSVAHLKIGLTLRDLLTKHGEEELDKRLDQIREERRYVIRRVLSPADEWQNLEAEQRQAALQATVDDYNKDPRGRQKEPSVPAGTQLRRQRRNDQPLLILYLLDNSKYRDAVPQPMVGFAISFPHSVHNVTAEYAVNEVWQKLQLPDLDDEDPDDDD